MAIIEIEHLTKEYKLGTISSLKDIARQSIGKLTGRSHLLWERQRFKALDDISLQITQGEVIGIIGHNGAGKSTLLKHLAKITKPTQGRVIVRGNIAPLIEVGAGFVPDLTGRENIYLNATILGLRKEEIRRKFDEIVNFSEIGEFIDTPVKRYSSGMQVKLAFAVATSVDAEIIIIDEVLAVGDVAFQRKCIGRIEQMINEEGRTVLIVGHNIRQLERVCSRMILLRNGRVEVDGLPGAVVKRFLDETTVVPQIAQEGQEGHVAPAVATGEIEVLSIDVPSASKIDGQMVSDPFAEFLVSITVRANVDLDDVEINIGLHNPEMIFISKTSTRLSDCRVDLKEGTSVINVVMEAVSVCPGIYGIGIGIYDWSRRILWGADRLQWIKMEAADKMMPRLPKGSLAYVKSVWRVE